MFPTKRTFYFLLQLAILITIAYFLISTAFNITEINSAPITSAITSSEASTSLATAFSPVPIVGQIPTEAKAVIVYDINSGTTLYSLNKDEPLPIASITKLMTVYTASVLLPLDYTITIDDSDAATESSAGLISGEKWKLSDLIAFTLVSSSNGGARAIAHNAEEASGVNFVDKMNSLAKEIGLTNTLFRNPTGLDINNDTMSGSYSTAYEVAKLYAYIWKNKPNLLAKTNESQLTERSDEQVHTASNTNEILATIPNLISSKTGTTDLAGGNLAFLFNPTGDRPIAVVVLGSTPAGRYTDAGKLVSATLETLRNNPTN